MVTCASRRLLRLLPVVILGFNQALAAPLSLEDLDWRPVASAKLGINTNYLLDGNISSGQLKREWKRTSSRWLRFPGGEKSDNHLWSTPPYERAMPRTALTGSWAWPAGDQRFFTNRDGKAWAVNPLDFDEFMRACRRVRAEPVVVICQQAAFKPKDARHGQISEETLIEAARAWVRYSKTKGYHVRYWEIGNEPYLKGSQTAKEFAASWSRFARAMKEEDPSILVGVNGPETAGFVDPAHQKSGPWWTGFLRAAEVRPDWISLHDYPCYGWKGYAAYATRPVNALRALDEIRAVLSQKYGTRYGQTVPLLVTETNSADWLGHPDNTGWSHASSLGHGLVLFDMLGQYLMEPQIHGVMVWNSRWLNNKDAPELWDAYCPRGSLLPTGKTLQIWNDFYPAELAAVPTTNGLRVYSGRGAKAGKQCLYLINKELGPTRVELPASPRRVWIWSGKSPDDPEPRWQSLRPSRVLILPAHSLAVAKF